ncbi:MAG: hypothetical protein Q7U04_11030 [Bacteriovorax sp.]|nr:hypothetical protein [Bacteriovorax sp.]
MNELQTKYINGVDIRKLKKTIDINNGKAWSFLEDTPNEVAEVTLKLSEEKISSIIKHPIITALIAGTIGFFSGIILAHKKIVSTKKLDKNNKS